MVTLRLDGVGACHGRRLTISGVSTPAFAGGEVVAVIGPNAAGKSTLFKRIAGLLNGPGHVVVEGARRGREGICYMPQDPATSAALSVYESVLLACKQNASWTVRNADLELVDGVLASLGIADIAFRGLAELSGGQRQLASLAQTLARRPEILLMDEPTSALDLQRQVQVLGLVRGLARDRGLLVLVALHDLNQVMRFADKVLVMAGGTARASGRCEDVITVDLLRDVYRIDARIERCSRGDSHVIVDG
ncbi:ABC transporter ATP-binding protein [Azospirillum sp.]|uniref:ABC transporter ATP-binding protein n=1 Tax=Azospirillum sp. TaxID=34012 RepID=UPI002D60CE11|nr:ABC transporter ATP-binding protein [Azospirillum sp.]HYD65501.1 ABC transporter ATP-binding protein [Azospirillum sp.]